MVLTENLKKDGIIIHSTVKSRWDIIKDLISGAAKKSLIPLDAEEEILQALIAREKSMTTGIGRSVAIPHCKVPVIKDIVILLATSVKGINFESIDNLPARVVIMLLVPASKAEKHVRVLSSIARLLSDEEFKEKLVTFNNQDEMLSYIREYEA